MTRMITGNLCDRLFPTWRCFATCVCGCTCACVNRVVKEEEEIACDNRKGGWRRRYCSCVSVCADREVSTETINWNYCECRVVVPALLLCKTHSQTDTVFYFMDLASPQRGVTMLLTTVQSDVI